MTAARRLALLSALALTACVSTNDEPFSLDDGDAVAPAANGYVCASYDAAGKRIAKTLQGRLIALRRNKKTQYVFLGDAPSPAAPFTLHQTKGNLTIVAVANSDAPGEGLYVAEFRNENKEFRLYNESDDLQARAQTLAREHGVTFAHNQYGSDLGGPVDAQKAFMVELASDLKGWKMSTDCRAKP
jgi:hypothetical protein